MCSLEALKIDLKELKEGLNSCEVQLDDNYFEVINAPEVRRGELCVVLSIRKTGALFELDSHIVGSIHIPCDRCLDDMEQPINTDNRLVVKLGETHSEENDLLIVPEDKGILDLSWIIYEFIALSIPIKHVHTPGKCNPAMIEMLAEHTATRSSNGLDEESMDPRWSGLEQLKTILKE